jgi:lamin tail-like protein/type IX secretion system substrate protein
LKDYISTRLNSIDNQIIINDINPIVYYTEAGIPAINQSLSVKAYIEDESEDLDITLFYSYGTISNSQTMSLENDARINTYLADLIVTEGSVFSYYITAEDNSGNTSRYPRSGFLEIPIQSEEYAGLYINEIMASNSNTVADNNGDFDDWVEIYNASANDIWLGNYYLSDNLSVPSKHKLPDMNLSSGAFYIVWADGEVAQGTNHADFKLSKDGEEIVLSKYVDGVYNIVDHFVFGLQSTDISFGKLPNGNGTPVFLSPTPGYGNIILSSPEIFVQEMELHVFPNPFNEFLHIETNEEISHVSIFNMYGQIVFDKTENKKDCSIDPKLQPGIYILMLRDKSNQIQTRKIIAN